MSGAGEVVAVDVVGRWPVYRFILRAAVPLETAAVTIAALLGAERSDPTSLRAKRNGMVVRVELVGIAEGDHGAAPGTFVLVRLGWPRFELPLVLLVAAAGGLASGLHGGPIEAFGRAVTAVLVAIPLLGAWSTRAGRALRLDFERVLRAAAAA